MNGKAPDVTLTEALLMRGFTHKESKHQQQRDIIDSAGNTVFRGSAQSTWEWLRGTK